jgi:hypothetical protein
MMERNYVFNNRIEVDFCSRQESSCRNSWRRRREMRRSVCGVAFWLILQGSAVAQIPEAPGHGGVGPRDEQPDEIQAPVPAVAPRVPTIAPKNKTTAHDTVETMEKAKANASAEASSTPTQRPKKHTQPREN